MAHLIRGLDHGLARFAGEGGRELGYVHKDSIDTVFGGGVRIGDGALA